MKTNLLIFVAIICLNIHISNASQQFVYTIHYVKSFRQDLVEKYIGCNEKNVAYGSYIYPQGAIDSLYIFANPGTYQARFNSKTQNLYVKLFGTGQNYVELLKTNPEQTALTIMRSRGRDSWKYIVDWKCPLKDNIQVSRLWLNKFVQKIQTNNVEVYVKAPASYFCYVNNGLKYLMDLDKPTKFIIQMYGQQPGVYTTYEEMFEKQTPRQGKDSQHYTQEACPKFPSYQTLSKNYPSKQFFIQKTLHKEQAGYIGPKFQKFLEKGASIYGKIAFYDSFPQQIIQL